MIRIAIAAITGFSIAAIEVGIVGLFAAASALDDHSIGVELVKQVPSLCVLVWIVLKFLGHISDTEKRQLQAAADRNAAHNALGESCHQFQRDLTARSTAVLEKVALAMEKNTETLGRNAESLERADAILERIDAILRKMDCAGEDQ